MLTGYKILLIIKEQYFTIKHLFETLRIIYNYFENLVGMMKCNYISLETFVNIELQNKDLALQDLVSKF